MIGFTVLKQHGLNPNLTIICTEWGNPLLVYAHKNPHNYILRNPKQITSNLFFTCDTTVSQLTGNNKNLSQLNIRGNLTHSISVKKLYYSAGHNACCCHCRSKRKPITDINCYPICCQCKP